MTRNVKNIQGLKCSSDIIVVPGACNCWSCCCWIRLGEEDGRDGTLVEERYVVLSTGGREDSTLLKPLLVSDEVWRRLRSKQFSTSCLISKSGFKKSEVDPSGIRPQTLLPSPLSGTPVNLTVPLTPDEALCPKLLSPAKSE